MAKIKEDILTFHYLEIRGLAGIEETKVTSCIAALDASRTERNRLDSEINEIKTREAKCEEELGSLWRTLSQNSAYVERERTKDQIALTTGQLEGDNSALMEAKGKEAEMHDVLRLLRLDMPLNTPNPAMFREVAYKAGADRTRAQSELDLLKSEGKELQGKLEGLKKGIRPASKEAVILKQLIEDQLQCKAPFLCELLDVTDEHWQPAVEGYLNTRRFDIVLSAKYFSKALSLYDKMKRQHNLHSVGLVDSEKVLRAAPKPKDGSLAELVTSDHRAAKAYADFIMGDLIRCESEQELRRHSRSITASCMVYQNHAARQTLFHVFDVWYIGSRGHARLIEQTEKKIADVFEHFKTTADEISRCQEVQTLAERGEAAAHKVAVISEIQARITQHMDDLSRLKSLLATLDSGEIVELERRLAKLRAEKTSDNDALDNALKRFGGLENQIATTGRELEAAEHQRDKIFADVAMEFSGEALSSKLGSLQDRYSSELSKGRSPQEIFKVYETAGRGRETMRTNILMELTSLRSDYNNKFGFSAPSQGEDSSPYISEMELWKNSYLPDYREKILKAKDSALQQLMEDIVHKLRENLDMIPSQFDQINRALRGFHFGLDQYQFTYKVKKEYEAFEKMIRDAALYENQPLFETNWKDRFRDHGALEGLFNNLIAGSSLRVQEELQQYSDYRQYYEYDLKIIHPDGSHSMYSNVNRWRSGGETQTPYYIAVLASLYRLYRLNADHESQKNRSTIGLVILDEAFNKMDEDHLSATLEFTRRLGLQLIMATPKERAEFIIPHIESCWIVTKDPASGYAFLLDYHQKLPSPASSYDESGMRNEATAQI